MLFECSGDRPCPRAWNPAWLDYNGHLNMAY